MVFEIAQEHSKKNEGIIHTKDCEAEALDHMSRSTFHDQWKKLVEAGHLISIKKGKYELRTA